MGQSIRKDAAYSGALSKTPLHGAAADDEEQQGEGDKDETHPVEGLHGLQEKTEMDCHQKEARLIKLL